MKYRILMGMLWLLGGALLIGIALTVYAITHAHTPDELLWSTRGAWAELSHLIRQQSLRLSVLVCALALYGALCCPWPGTSHMRMRQHIMRVEKARREWRTTLIDQVRVCEFGVWMLAYLAVALPLSTAPLWFRYGLAVLLALSAVETMRLVRSRRYGRGKAGAAEGGSR